MLPQYRDNVLFRESRSLHLSALLGGGLALRPEQIANRRSAAARQHDAWVGGYSRRVKFSEVGCNFLPFRPDRPKVVREGITAPKDAHADGMADHIDVENVLARV